MLAGIGIESLDEHRAQCLVGREIAELCEASAEFEHTVGCPRRWGRILAAPAPATVVEEARQQRDVRGYGLVDEFPVEEEAQTGHALGVVAGVGHPWGGL